MPPVKISAVVLPLLIRSRTSSIVRFSIQTLSCMSIGRGISRTSTRGAVFTDAVRRSPPGVCGVAGACAPSVGARCQGHPPPRSPVHRVEFIADASAFEFDHLLRLAGQEETGALARDLVGAGASFEAGDLGYQPPPLISFRGVLQPPGSSSVAAYAT